MHHTKLTGAGPTAIGGGSWGLGKNQGRGLLMGGKGMVKMKEVFFFFWGGVGKGGLSLLIALAALSFFASLNMRS